MPWQTWKNPQKNSRRCPAKRGARRFFDFEQREALLGPFLDAPVLLLDDLFKTRRDKNGIPEASRQEQDVAFLLIDSRYRQKKRTIITTEMQPGALRQLNQALFGRIRERSGEHILSVPYGSQYDQRLHTA